MVTPPPTQGRLRRNLLIAFLLCLLFAPLALAMGRLFPLLNYTNCVFAVVTVVSASAILYPKEAPFGAGLHSVACRRGIVCLRYVLVACHDCSRNKALSYLTPRRPLASLTGNA